MSNIYLSHETALEFWRLWSARNSIALRLFHQRRATQTDDLPFRVFPSSAVITHAASTKRDIAKIIEGTLEAEMSEELGILLQAHCDALSRKTSLKPSSNLIRQGSMPGATMPDSAMPSATMPNNSSSDAEGMLHVLGCRKPGKRAVKGLAYHHSSATYPKGSFLKVAPGVYVCAPELVFAQMASSLPFGALLALGYELCGCYPLEGKEYLVRHPLCSPNRLTAFCSKLRRFKGSEAAKAAARYVLAKSASPAETSLAIIATTPRNYGGFGVKGARLNEPVRLSCEAERIAHGSMLVCDILWPEFGVAFEYDSSLYHSNATQLSRDSRRRSALAAQGLEVRSITASQFESVFEFQETILHTFRVAGRKFQRLNGKQLDRHMKLRGELRRRL